MSKADEMFKELGYTETEKYKNGIEYIDIDKDECISFMDYDIQDKTIGCTNRISMQELQAINEKVKELRLDRRKTMSSFLSKNEKGEYVKEIESMEVCKWKINEICVNDKSDYLADYPSPFCKCESKEDCEYFEKEEENIF